MYPVDGTSYSAIYNTDSGHLALQGGIIESVNYQAVRGIFSYGDSPIEELTSSDKILYGQNDVYITDTDLVINGVNIPTDSFNVYHIWDTHYFKLRDLAMLLKDTSCAFNVKWEEGVIKLLPHTPYEIVGAERRNLGQ